LGGTRNCWKILPLFRNILEGGISGWRSFISSFPHCVTMDKRSKALFEWSIANATASEDTTATQVSSSTLDPGVIDAILGPDDATLMRESMAAIKDTSLSLDDRSPLLSPFLFKLTFQTNGIRQSGTFSRINR
jgi:hypothetical protein